MRTFLKKLATTLLLSIVLLAGSGVATYANMVDELLPSIDYTSNEHIDGLIDNYKNLPKQEAASQEYTAIARTGIKLMLYVASGLVIIGLFVVAIMYMTGSMEEENINKAKKILGYLALGILVMSVAYALVTGITSIDLFDSPSAS